MIHKLINLVTKKRQKADKSEYNAIIADYYSQRNNGAFAHDIIEHLSKYLSTQLYDLHKGSIKDDTRRKETYTRLLVEALNSVVVQDKVIDFLKMNYNISYRGLCAKLFEMSIDDFVAFERRRNQFHNK